MSPSQKAQVKTTTTAAPQAGKSADQGSADTYTDTVKK